MPYLIAHIMLERRIHAELPVSISFDIKKEWQTGGVHFRRNGHHLDAERLKSSNYMCQCLGLCSSLSSAKRAGKTPWEFLLQLADHGGVTGINFYFQEKYFKGYLIR